MSKQEIGYHQAAEMTLEIVREFRMFGSGRPDFVAPSRRIGLIADLRDVGKYVARNDAARELLAKLQKAFARADVPPPTLMMLLVALDMCGIPAKEVPFEELGIPGTLARFQGKP
jgi:hypothetical protein